MAEKRNLRDRALDAFGDFAHIAPISEEDIRQKMADLYEQDAKERGEDETSISLAKALIIRDGNLDALGRKDAESGQKYEWGGETFDCELPELVKHDETIRRGSTAAKKPKAKPKTAITPEKKAHFEELIDAEKERAAQAKKISTVGEYWAEVKRRDDAAKAEKAAKEAARPEEKRKQGRPRKHDSGGQISVWFDDKMKAAVNQRAMVWHCSFSDAVNRLLMLAIKGHM